MATLPSTDEGGRIITLDIIRGIAVMGIFSVNVIAFAMVEGAYFNPSIYGGHTGGNFAIWATNMVLIDGKMRTLFSMLFGASMLLVIERAEAAGRSGALVHVRRMLVLLAVSVTSGAGTGVGVGVGVGVGLGVGVGEGVGVAPPPLEPPPHPDRTK